MSTTRTLKSKPRSKSKSNSKSRSKSSSDENYHFTPIDTNDPDSNLYNDHTITDSPRTPLTKPSTETHHSSKSTKNGKYQSISVSPSLSSSQSKSPSELSSSSLSNNHESYTDHLQTAKQQTSKSYKKYTPWYCKFSNWLKIFISMGLLTLLTLAVVFNDITMKYSEQFLNWMDDHPFSGSLAYIGLYIISSIIMIPGSLLTLGAGFVYVKMFGEIEGVIFASIVVWIGASIGATFAFINGRYLLRNIVIHYTTKSSKFQLIDNVVGMNGFKVTFLLRLSPITPYNVFNYFMGLTSVKLTSYMFACIGMIPDCIVYCFIGGSIASIAKLSSVGFASDPLLLIVTIVGSIASVCGILYISYVAKKEFNKMAMQSRMNMRRNIEENVLLNEDIAINEHSQSGHAHTSNGAHVTDTTTIHAAVQDIYEDDLVNHNDMDIHTNFNVDEITGTVLGHSLSDLRTIGPNNSLQDNKLAVPLPAPVSNGNGNNIKFNKNIIVNEII